MPSLGEIKNPAIFFGAAAVLVAYVLYTMIRQRKGLRPGHKDQESEL